MIGKTSAFGQGQDQVPRPAKNWVPLNVGCVADLGMVRTCTALEKTDMFGLQEILIITAIILGLLFIPRMTAKKQPNPPLASRFRVSGKMRMAIAASAVYVALTAAFFRPWHKDPVMFLYVGIGPVALGWLVGWVLVGFKKR